MFTQKNSLLGQSVSIFYWDHQDLRRESQRSSEVQDTGLQSLIEQYKKEKSKPAFDSDDKTNKREKLAYIKWQIKAASGRSMSDSEIMNYSGLTSNQEQQRLALESSPQAEPLNTKYSANVLNTMSGTQAKTVEHRGNVNREQEEEYVESLIWDDSATDYISNINTNSLMSIIATLNKREQKDFLNRYDNFERNSWESGKEARERKDRAKWNVLAFLKDRWYVSNGSFWPTEQTGVMKLAKKMIEGLNDRNAKQKYRKFTDGYLLWVGAAAQMRTQQEAQNLNTNNLESFLAGTYENARVTKSHLTGTLETYFKRDPSNINKFSQRFLGKPASSREQLLAHLKANPEARFKFYNAIDQAARFEGDYGKGYIDSILIGQVVNGTLASDFDERLNSAGAEKLVSEKLKTVLSDIENQIKSANLSSEEKTKLLFTLNNLNTQRIKWRILTDIGTHIWANIEKGNMGAWVAKTYETAIKGLTISPSLGYSEKWSALGLVVRYGGSTDLWTVNGYDVNVGWGLNAGYTTAGFIYFADASVNIRKKFTSLNGSDITAKTHWLHVIGWPGFGFIGYSNLDRRVDNINKNAELMSRFLAELATLPLTSETIRQDIEIAAAAVGADWDTFLKGPQKEKFFQYMENLGLNSNTGFQTKLLMIQSFAGWERENYLMNEMQNTKDAPSYGGVMAGAWLAWSTPLVGVGVNMYQVKGWYENMNGAWIPNTVSGTMITGAEVEEALQIAQESSLPAYLKTPKAVQFFLNARYDAAFRKYQVDLTRRNSHEDARAALTAYVKKHSKGLKNATGMTVSGFQKLIADNDVLSQILVLTSGTNTSRNLGRLIAYEPENIRRNPKMVETVRKTSLKAAENGFGSPWLFKDYYSRANFKRHLEGWTQTMWSVSSNYFGSISYSQIRAGRARGLDQLSADTPVYGVESATSAQAKVLLPKLVNEFKNDRPRQFEDLKNQLAGYTGWAVTDSDMISLLNGDTRTINGKKVTPSLGVKLCMSGELNATCFNGCAFVEVGPWKIDGKKVTPFVEQTGQINNFSARQKDWNIGLMYTGTKQEWGPDHTDTETWGETVDDVTTTETWGTQVDTPVTNVTEAWNQAPTVTTEVDTSGTTVGQRNPFDI